MLGDKKPKEQSNLRADLEARLAEIRDESKSRYSEILDDNRGDDRHRPQRSAERVTALADDGPTRLADNPRVCYYAPPSHVPGPTPNYSRPNKTPTRASKSDAVRPSWGSEAAMTKDNDPFTSDYAEPEADSKSVGLAVPAPLGSAELEAKYRLMRHGDLELAWPVLFEDAAGHVNPLSDHDVAALAQVGVSYKDILRHRA